MKSSIHDKDTHSFIVYHQNRPPRFFQIKNKSLSFFFYVLPIITIITFTISILLAIYTSKFSSLVKKSEPELLATLKKQIQEQSLKQQELESFNQNLKAKLESTDFSLKETFPIFKTHQGQQNLANQTPFNVDKVLIQKKDNGVEINFNLVNKTPDEKKIAGHLFVILRYENTFKVFPSSPILKNERRISFESGEPFATSRFRPVVAFFALEEGVLISKFQLTLLLFSRTGDIIHFEDLTEKLPI